MAVSSYTKTTYVNGTTPAINASNLNKIETQVSDLTLAVRGAGITNYGTRILAASSPDFNTVAQDDLGKLFFFEDTETASVTAKLPAFAGSVGTEPRHWEIISHACTSTRIVQIAWQVFDSGSGYKSEWRRMKHETAWSSWVQVWDSRINGGLEPAPKPRESTGNIGSLQRFAAAVNSAAVLPSGGTWAYFIINYSGSTGNPLFASGSAPYVGVKAGGTTIASADATYGYTGFVWRVS